jgi:hypothetical protein
MRPPTTARVRPERATTAKTTYGAELSDRAEFTGLVVIDVTLGEGCNRRLEALGTMIRPDASDAP